MKYKYPILLILYAIALILTIIGGVTQNIELEYISKPLLMPLLGAWLWANVGQSRLRNIILIALFFSWLGDVLLMLQHKEANLFIFGLIAFLLAHLAYIIGFSYTNRPRRKGYLREHPWLLLPFAAYALCLFYPMRQALSEQGLTIPVLIYAAVLCGMAAAAANRYLKVNYNSFSYVFVGAILFVLSDSIIGLNKFYHAIPWASFWIMLAYGAAQYFIVWGIYLQIIADDKTT